LSQTSLVLAAEMDLSHCADGTQLSGELESDPDPDANACYNSTLYAPENNLAINHLIGAPCPWPPLHRTSVMLARSLTSVARKSA